MQGGVKIAVYMLRTLSKLDCFGQSIDLKYPVLIQYLTKKKPLSSGSYYSNKNKNQAFEPLWFIIVKNKSIEMIGSLHLFFIFRQLVVTSTETSNPWSTQLCQL